MKYQIRKVAHVPSIELPIFNYYDVEELRYDMGVMEHKHHKYVARFEIATLFQCHEDVLGEFLEEVIFPQLRTHVYQELIDLVHQLRYAIYENKMRLALQLLDDMYKLVHKGPEYEVVG